MRSSEYHPRLDKGELVARAFVIAMALWTGGLAISCNQASRPAHFISQPQGEIPDCQSVSDKGAPCPSSALASASIQRAAAGNSPSPGNGAANMRWALAERWPSFQKVVERRRSQHLQESVEAEVFVNAQATNYRALGPSQTLGAGAVIVEALFEPGAEKPALLFVMEKQVPGTFGVGAAGANKGDWSFLIVLPDGKLGDQERSPLCIRCHAEAPHHFLFGPPQGTL